MLESPSGEVTDMSTEVEHAQPARQWPRRRIRTADVDLAIHRRIAAAVAQPEMRSGTSRSVTRRHQAIVIPTLHVSGAATPGDREALRPCLAPPERRLEIAAERHQNASTVPGDVGKACLLACGQTLYHREDREATTMPSTF